MQITVNEKNIKIEGNQLIINMNAELEKALGLNKSVLLSVEPGTVINDQYIVLEHFKDGTTAVMKKKLLEETMEFSDSDNDWRKSKVRGYLNHEYLKEIEIEFGKENIVEHTVDLLSLDGLDDYGTSQDKVSLLTIDRYRKYRKVFGENMNRWWWLATPNSTPSGWSSSYVRYVDDDGSVNFSDYSFSWSLRPFFILQSSIVVAL